MKPWVRRWLLWVVVAALPVQGLAASFMLFCGPSHQRMAPGHAAGPQGSMPSHLHAHAAPGGVSAHDEAVPADAPAGGDTATAAGGLAAPHGDFSCSACAACCNVLAPPAGFVLPAPPLQVQALVPASIAPVRSHHPDGPERPPRTVLA